MIFFPGICKHRRSVTQISLSLFCDVMFDANIKANAFRPLFLRILFYLVVLPMPSVCHTQAKVDKETSMMKVIYRKKIYKNETKFTHAYTQYKVRSKLQAWWWPMTQKISRFVSLTFAFSQLAHIVRMTRVHNFYLMIYLHGFDYSDFVRLVLFQFQVLCIRKWVPPMGIHFYTTPKPMQQHS